MVPMKFLMSNRSIIKIIWNFRSTKILPDNKQSSKYLCYIKCKSVKFEFLTYPDYKTF